ncbi:MAG: tetratricopeptide repeat protein [Planctomycetes bacterium]|nr:tetratricopeptide repeat protein [Planctomycetota bacterium]
MAIAVAIAIAFGNSLHGVFVLDDIQDLVASRRLEPLWPPTAELWATPGLGLSGRPLAAFSFAVDRALHGLEPAGYRVTNLVIHLCAAWCLFGVVRELLSLARVPEAWRARRDGLAFASALLWAVHPIQVTSVTYVIQRCESLMGLCLLAGVYCALRGFRGERRARWWGLAAFAMALGAMVKESIVVLPVVVLVLDVGFASGSLTAAWRARRGLHVSLFAVWLWVAFWVRVSGFQRASTAGLLPELTWWVWLKSQAAALAHYVRMALVPDPVLIDYGWPIPHGVSEWLPAALAVVAVLVVAFVAWWRKSRVATVVVVAFLLLAPTSSVLPIPYELRALHRMYLPLACLVALGVCGVSLLLERLRVGRVPSFALLLLVASAAIAKTRAENRVFDDAEGFWMRHVAALPENDRAWFQLGEARRKNGDLHGAHDAYVRAVELHPTFPRWLNNLATLELGFGDVDLAIARYERALALEPTATLERENLVGALLVRGDFERAERELAPRLAADPDSGVVRRLHARLLARTGREAAAFAEARAVLERDRNDFGAFELMILLQTTALDDTVRDVAAADARLAAVRPKTHTRDAELGRVRAVLAAAKGRFDEAQALARPALELARREQKPQLAADLERELALYARREAPRGTIR